MYLGMATSIILFIFCMATTTCAQTNQQRCSDMIIKVNELKTAIEGMCITHATPPPVTLQNFYSPFNWTSVAKTFIGTSNLQHASTITFTIPSVIPSSAREVLILAGINSGLSNRGPYHDIKVFTQIGSNRYEKYLTLYSWNQIAQNTNSDNMWFPMPPNRRVYLTVPAAHGNNAVARLFAIGYR